jgi:hypothetical protein
MRLTHERWLASGWANRVDVAGVADCTAFFGLG